VGRNKVTLAVILLITGFFLSFSYQYVHKMNEQKTRISSEQWQRENDIRKQLIDEQDKNRELQAKLDNIRGEIQDEEKRLSDQEAASTSIVKKLNTYRMVNGETKVQGPGIEVTLSDADYSPDAGNPDDYIVHQQDIQEVIYELLAAGAEGVAVNGERFTARSYIECVGPVVKMDGHKHTAPFVISAIGSPSTLMGALNLNGGAAELLIARGISVTVEKKDAIVLNPIL